ncbi:hypothetical protein [Kribbella shirazensis]|uniref:Uncharacterized protein n=1 Tax=Kribbella shirazensis TaxID=1105143 RepID=A0A7X5VA28_9ACTN|nr:hypothetical protein [Kribbella shirazensis]NIK57358.1 hypothetical protein [Kribbella shirazensis]
MNPPDRVSDSSDRVDLTKAPLFGWVLLILGGAFMLFLLYDLITHGLPATPGGWIFAVPGFALALILLYAGWSFRTDHRYVDASGLTHERHGKTLQSIAFASLTRISLQEGAAARQGNRTAARMLVLEGQSRDGGAPTRFAVSSGCPNIEALYRFLSPYLRANPGLLDEEARSFYNTQAPKHGVDAVS